VKGGTLRFHGRGERDSSWSDLARAFPPQDPIEMRYIEYMPFEGTTGAAAPDVPGGGHPRAARDQLELAGGSAWRRPRARLSRPGKNGRAFRGRIGISSSMTEPFCATCIPDAIDGGRALRCACWHEGEIDLRGPDAGRAPRMRSCATDRDGLRAKKPAPRQEAPARGARSFAVHDEHSGIGGLRDGRGRGQLAEKTSTSTIPRAAWPERQEASSSPGRPSRRGLAGDHLRDRQRRSPPHRIAQLPQHALHVGPMRTSVGGLYGTRAAHCPGRAQSATCAHKLDRTRRAPQFFRLARPPARVLNRTLRCALREALPCCSIRDSSAPIGGAENRATLERELRAARAPGASRISAASMATVPDPQSGVTEGLVARMSGGQQEGPRASVSRSGALPAGRASRA